MDDNLIQRDKLNLENVTYNYKGLKQEMLIWYTQKPSKHSVIYIHGHNGNAYKALGMRGKTIHLAGYNTCLPTVLGYDSSEGKRDFCGPETIEALNIGLQIFLDSKDIDENNVAIWGKSRGASVVSQIITQNKFKFKAAVLQAGIYDYEEAYNRKEMPKGAKKKDYERELGKVTKEKLVDRSSIHNVKNIKTPVLVLHGKEDENVSVKQAELMDKALNKYDIEHETKIIEGKDHYFESSPYVLPFLKNYLN